ncbi:protein Niban 3 isoform X2 [Lissotriton helveticus]
MGGGHSQQPDVAQRRYLRGRTEAVVKTFIPYYHRQVAAAILRRLWSEGEPQGRHSQQLMQCQVWRSPEARLHQGALLYFKAKSRKWKESCLAVRGDYTLEWDEEKPVQAKCGRSKACSSLSGYKLATSLQEYAQLVSAFSRVLTVGSSADRWPFLPTDFPLFLYHPFCRHYFFCCSSAESHHAWKCALREGIRHHNTVLQRGDSSHVEAFLESVRFFRQEKGRYGAWDHLLGTEPEILSNLVMEDLLPVLESSAAPLRRGAELRQQSAWFQEVYSLILTQVSKELEGFKEEKETLHRTLEKKIRPDLDQLRALKDQISEKLEGAMGSAVRACFRESVHPHLEQVLDELVGPVTMGLEDARSAFDNRIIEMMEDTEGSSPLALQKEVYALSDMPWDSVLLRRCYERVFPLQEGLRGLGDRFDLRAVDWLLFRAQNLMQQFLQNTVYTFQQLLGPHLTASADITRLVQTLGKVKGRVLKKFDSDSSRARRRFARDTLVDIFLPFLLKRLEPHCKRELPKYDCYVFADYSAILHVENIYEDIVRGVLLEAVDEALKDASRQQKHRLGSESLASILESAENLLGLDQAPRDHGRGGRETPERGTAPGSTSLATDAEVNLPRQGAVKEYIASRLSDDTAVSTISYHTLQESPHPRPNQNQTRSRDNTKSPGNAQQGTREAGGGHIANFNGVPIGSASPQTLKDGTSTSAHLLQLGLPNGTSTRVLSDVESKGSQCHSLFPTQNGGIVHANGNVLMETAHVIYGNLLAYTSHDRSLPDGKDSQSDERDKDPEFCQQNLALDVTKSSSMLEDLSLELEKTISQIDQDLLEIDQTDNTKA